LVPALPIPAWGLDRSAESRVGWSEWIGRPGSWIRESCTSPPASRRCTKFILIATQRWRALPRMSGRSCDFNVSVLVEQNGRREQGYCGTGGRFFSLADLVAGDKPLALGREAVRQALVNLEAKPAPAGSMTVVLGPGLARHSAARGHWGHGLEGDFNRKGTSAFAKPDRGARSGSRMHHCRRWERCPRRRGFVEYRRRGARRLSAPLSSRDGRACGGYIQDKLNARLMGAKTHG